MAGRSPTGTHWRYRGARDAFVDEPDVMKREKKIMDAGVLDNSKPAQALVGIHVLAAGAADHDVRIEAPRRNVGPKLLIKTAPALLRRPRCRSAR
jgi:hypothetical protein